MSRPRKKLYCSVQGVYKGYKCDSLWELAFVVYNLDNGIKFSRNEKAYPYTWYGKTRWYYPDFILEDGTFVEIKGVKTGQDVRKIDNFPYNIKLMEYKDIKPYLDYVTVKYGSDISKLYEESKTVWYKK